MIIIKDGVDVRGLHYMMWQAVYIILPIFDNQGINLVITSGVEGEHKWGSLHYLGCAIDIRRRDLTSIDDIFISIKEHLPEGFDVVLEHTHIHIEWQPKNQHERTY